MEQKTGNKVDRVDLFNRILRDPGINLGQMAAGTCVRVETAGEIYEIVLIDPATRRVQLTATDPRLKQSVVGRFSRSILEDDEQYVLPGWIKKGMAMQFTFQEWDKEFGFQDTTFTSGPVVSARVEGKGANGKSWHFDVF